MARLDDRTRTVLEHPNRKLTAVEIDELVAAYQAGMDIARLSRQFGMHRQTARNHLLRRGIRLRSDSPVLSQPQIDELARLYSSGLSTIRLGELYGVGASTVRLALVGAGVKLRPRGGYRCQQM